MGGHFGQSLALPLWFLGATALSVWLSNVSVLAVAALAILAARTAVEGAAGLGWANGLTWLRIVVTAALVLLPAGLPLVALAFAIFALDGADGALARVLGTVSDFGAELDKECDAFFVLMLGVLLWHHGQAGLWVLVPGLWRYTYSLLIALATEVRPAPRSNWSRYSYSASCLCLIAALWQGTPRPEVLAAMATVLISVSFLRSLYFAFARS